MAAFSLEAFHARGWTPNEHGAGVPRAVIRHMAFESESICNHEVKKQDVLHSKTGQAPWLRGSNQGTILQSSE